MEKVNQTQEQLCKEAMAAYDKLKENGIPHLLITFPNEEDKNRFVHKETHGKNGNILMSYHMNRVDAIVIVRYLIEAFDLDTEFIQIHERKY